MRQNTIYQIPIWTLQERNRNIDHWMGRRGMQKCHCRRLQRKRKNALIVLTGGLLILLRWALILLNLCNGVKVLLAVGWEGGGNGELEGMGWENAVAIEVRSRRKATKEGSVGSRVFWEVERANLREWFSKLVSSAVSSFACMHCCCLLVWPAAKYGSFLCFVQETEYPFMSIQNRRTTKKNTTLLCYLPSSFQIINNSSHCS